MRAHANAHSRPIVHSRDAEMISIVKSNINLTFNEHKKKTQALTTTIKQKVCKAHNSQQYNWPAMSRIQEEEVESKKTRTIVEKWLSEGKRRVHVSMSAHGIMRNRKIMCFSLLPMKTTIYLCIAIILIMNSLGKWSLLAILCSLTRCTG